MYSINKKNNFKYDVLALNINDKKAKNKKNYEIFFENQQYYVVVDPKNFVLADFLWNLRSAVQTIKDNANVKLDTFNNILKFDNFKEFVIGFITIHEYIDYFPFSLKTKNNFITLNFESTNKDIIKAKNEIEGILSGFNFARELQLRPSNKLNPRQFVNFALEKLEPYKDQLEIKVFDLKKLQAKKMGLILAVGQASSIENSPYLLSVKFKNKLATTTLVGKGITFDTGGINLKPSSCLFSMQYDMSGAAITIGILLALLKNKKQLNMGFVIPLANNDIGPNSIKVGDVVTSYSKKTVEITNSDAEGRLILSDAVTYAINDFKAKKVVTLATLTGAVVYALGNVFSGYYSTNDTMAEKINKFATISGEYVWRMPLHTKYHDAIVSGTNIADCVNSPSTREAGSIVGAEFIRLFANDSVDFVHFDIAGTTEYPVNGVSSPFPALFLTLYNLINYGSK